MPSDLPVAAVAPRRTMSHDAVERLHELIIMGTIPQGAPLRLEDLARTLEMSISPVREAIRQLEMIGLAEHVPYKGARVTYLSVGELHAVHDTRVALESLAARHTVACYSDELDARLEAALANLDEAYASRDRSRIVHGNTTFHLALAAGSGSPWLHRLISQTLEVWERYSAALILGDDAEETYADEARGHHEILEACRARDAEAAADAIRRHLAVSQAIFERRGITAAAVLNGRRDGS
jgi:DNA-binding GntR family transcriptional regulator